MTAMIYPLLLLQGIPELIDQLADESIERREAAREQLRRRIREAMPDLRKAAESGNQDIRAAARDLVARHSAGALLWKFECPHGGTPIKPLAIVGAAGGLVLVECGCVGGPLLAVDAETGKARWESKAGAGYATHYSLQGDVVLASVNTGPDRLVAVEAASGKDRWTFEGKKGLHRPVVDGDAVLIGGGDGVRSIDLRSGKERWHFANGAWTSTPATGARLVCVSFDGKIRALDRGTGKPAWEFAGDGRASPAAVVGDAVYVGDEKKLHAIRLDSGASIWSAAVKGGSHEAPRVAGGVVYHSVRFLGPKSESGGHPTLARYYAVEAATGKILREEARLMPVPGPHDWEKTKEGLRAAECRVKDCRTPHRLLGKTVDIDGQSIALLLTPEGRLADAEGAAVGPRLVTTWGGFPVTSGRLYDGPRKSAVIALRGVDVDRE